MGQDLFQFAIRMVALIICFTIHEFSHAYSAYRAGDDTAKLAGRISLNPIDHLDTLGTIMMVVSSWAGFGIGWGKPVPVNPNRMRRPRWDNLMVSLWGPLSNLLTAAVVGTILRFAAIPMATSQSPLVVNVGLLLGAITGVSIVLAIFNLIPIPPLDGSHILSALLPYQAARKYDMFARQYGMFLLLALIILPGNPLMFIIGPPFGLLWHLFTGM
jgi:Zn-dependent protease